jgi:hypothetical protein
MSCELEGESPACLNERQTGTETIFCPSNLCLSAWNTRQILFGDAVSDKDATDD